VEIKENPKSDIDKTYKRNIACWHKLYAKGLGWDEEISKVADEDDRTKEQTDACKKAEVSYSSNVYQECLTIAKNLHVPARLSAAHTSVLMKLEKPPSLGSTSGPA
jgi:hypothetical protein